MPLTAIYAPSPQFFSPRSYFAAWACYTNAPHIVQHDQTFIAFDNNTPPYFVEIKLLDRAWDWSSDVYSLDHLIDYAIYYRPTTPEAGDLFVEIIYQPTVPFGIPVLQVNQVGAPNFASFAQLPAAPTNYWLQLPNVP